MTIHNKRIKINKYWRPKFYHALGILLSIMISFVAGYAFGSQEIIAAIGTVLSFGYAAKKMWDAFFKGRKDD